ncbi:MAG TPA: hypothetical protein EYP33_06930 [Pyrodictium sp.]|nr:hypothetical protein [Pyrodictium sp.]
MSLDKNTLLELYKLYVQTAEETSKKRLQTNHFYILINSFLVSTFIAFSNYFKDADLSLSPLSIAGVVVSILWYFHLDSYRKLNKVKYSIIIDIEKSLKYFLFLKEWKLLKEHYNYKELTKIEKILPVVFIIIYCFYLLYLFLF